MKYNIINCDSLLKKITKKDELFNGNYCIDPYQNCEFGCSYCDSSFDSIIYIKNNSAEKLESELSYVKKGVIIIGSVHDPYQNAERKYELTRKILKVIKKYDFPCHILTKSDLVLRDLDILTSIDCNVTMSILSLNDRISKIFEKNAPRPKKRLEILKKLRKNKIKAGLALIPILPYVIDDEIELIIKYAKKYYANYLLFKYLELKGEQKILFDNLLKNHYPNLVSKYNDIYKNKIKPDSSYFSDIDLKIRSISKKYGIENKIIQ